MTARAKASIAQARFLARTWGEDRKVPFMARGRDGEQPYNTPTVVACVARGWFVPDGMNYFENGFEWQPHSVSAAGLLALESFLADQRMDAAFRKAGVK